MTPYGMGMQIERIDLEIQPVEGEGLDEAQHRLAEEGVDAKRHRGLVKQPDDGVAEHERDEGSRPLNAMLDVRPRRELEDALQPRAHPAVLAPGQSREQRRRRLPKHIERNDGPDERLPSWLFNMHTRNPQRRRHHIHHHARHHRPPHHGNHPRIPAQTRRNKQPRREIKTDQTRPRAPLLPRRRNIRRIPEQTTQHKQHRKPPQHIIALKPRNQHRDIAPELPSQNKRDGEVQQRRSRGVLCGGIA
jgi:hypothetical protein